jgi:transcriptional regulator with XRE-family HTH domain
MKRRITMRDLRIASQMTQVELALRAGLGQNDISRLELGKTPSPTLKTITRLARALETDLNTIGIAVKASVAEGAEG